ncbi:hypothetical protein DFP73DRAFT_527756 [Morchella snyderi]|nr:hypothetical protein DFP73DRAFT_527756 [Morchella snyderi]
MVFCGVFIVSKPMIWTWVDVNTMVFTPSRKVLVVPPRIGANQSDITKRRRTFVYAMLLANVLAALSAPRAMVVGVLGWFVSYIRGDQNRLKWVDEVAGEVLVQFFGPMRTFIQVGI